MKKQLGEAIKNDFKNLAYTVEKIPKRVCEFCNRIERIDDMYGVSTAEFMCTVCIKKKHLLEQLRDSAKKDLEEHKERMMTELNTTWEEIEKDQCLAEFSLWITKFNLEGRLGMLEDLITEIL